MTNGRGLLVLLLLMAQPGAAQTITYIPATGYFIQARTAASTQVGPMLGTQLSEWLCNQTPEPPAPPDLVTNPRTVTIVDVDRAGKVCRLDIVGWRSILPAGTRYTLWVGATAAGFNEVAVAPGWPDFVRALTEFNVVPTTSALPPPKNGRLLPP